jgi:hypothetical protein
MNGRGSERASSRGAGMNAGIVAVVGVAVFIAEQTEQTR